jgi:hypothetical protein
MRLTLDRTHRPINHHDLLTVYLWAWGAGFASGVVLCVFVFAFWRAAW